MRYKAGWAIIAILLCSCRENHPLPQPAQGVQVQPVRISAGDAPAARYSAVVMPDTQVPLAFRVPGYVTALLRISGPGSAHDLGEGDHVNKGAVLARLRMTEYEDKLQQAGSQAEAAEAAAHKAALDFDRSKRLFDSQSLTKPEFDGARAQYDATQAQLRAAHAQESEAGLALRDTSLSAPFSGEIVKKLVEVGSFVGPGTPAFVLANTDAVKVTVGIPDVTLRGLSIGRPVAITVEAIPNRTFNARITRIAAAADVKTRNFEVEVAIPNHDHLLKPGMIAALQFAAGVPPEQLPLVPLAAIVQSTQGHYGVFLLGKAEDQQVARFRPVEVGAVRGGEIEILRGLGAGDPVITTGATILKDGQPVEVLR